MTLAIQPADENNPHFVARVTGLNIANGVSTETVTLIENAIDQHGVLIFPDQPLNDQQQYTFSEKFGPMEKATGDINTTHNRRLSLDINDISNLDHKGNVLARDSRERLFGLGNMLWHSDSSFKKIPAKYSLLSARVIPESGGNTEFADMRRAWDKLDTSLQDECKDLICMHSQIYSRGVLGFDDFTEEERRKWSPVQQKLVRRHPRTNRQSLFLSSHIGGISGWPVPEARLFISDLTEQATQSHNVYVHQWKQHDLVMWDNRVTMHRARRYDHTQHRDLHRTTVSDSSSTLEQAL